MEDSRLKSGFISLWHEPHPLSLFYLTRTPYFIFATHDLVAEVHTCVRGNYRNDFYATENSVSFAFAQANLFCGFLTSMHCNVQRKSGQNWWWKSVVSCTSFAWCCTFEFNEKANRNNHKSRIWNSSLTAKATCKEHTWVELQNVFVTYKFILQYLTLENCERQFLLRFLKFVNYKKEWLN